ncbi:aldo/keto reductase [Gordonia aichiensis]|uniref:aldo/keto reductase n=1 Tax=Gordonia aichiensis TaxID=36820 RepID=UPI0006899D18|nr:aldo/keto reductase [Gordonia aichiensis]
MTCSPPPTGSNCRRGFGTFKLNGSDGSETIARAIDTGYTLVDSAFNYENEGAVGRAVRRASTDRDKVIVTSKLPGRHHAYDEALATIEESVYRTGLDHLDLYLIHWPNPKVDKYVEAWTALIEARRRGLVREIGVCNFLPEHLDRLEAETSVVPVVNQIELHPYFPQEETLAYDRAHGIITEAWSPLGRGNDLLTNPVITGIAERVDASPGQVVLAWQVARGALPLPKASSLERQVENLTAPSVTLSEEDVDAITALGRPDGRNNDQDPATYEEF